MTRLATFTLLAVAPLTAASIEGRVTNSVTGDPISGATVRLLDRHSYVFYATTDATGSYTLTNLNDGDYRGEFSKDGFNDARAGATLADVLSGGGWVHASGDVPARIDAQLQPWASLRGRVVDEDGHPAPKVAVEINLNLDNVATTDEHGEFTFSNLRPGSYTLLAKPDPQTHQRNGEQVGAVPIYYPSATQLADASLIKVNWGADVAGIEIRLKSVPVHRIAGLVLDEAGKPIAHATVKLLGKAPASRQALMGISGAGPFIRSPVPFLTISGEIGPAPQPILASVESHNDGTFEFAAVEPGDWRLSAEAGVDDEKPRAGVASVFIGDKDADGVAIRLSAPFSVEVTADWGDTPPPKAADGGPSPIGYLVRLAPLDAQPRVAFDPSAVTSIKGLFPGRYRVLGSQVLAAQEGTYVSAVLLGGTGVLGQIVDLAPGGGPLEVILKHDSGSLRGTVDNGEGATVYLVPKNPAEVIRYVSVICGRGGSFQFQNVIPGDYYLVAFHSVDSPPPDLPDSIATIATTVKVESGSAPFPVNLRTSPWLW
jgi:hypothetical protein